MFLAEVLLVCPFTALRAFQDGFSGQLGALGKLLGSTWSFLGASWAPLRLSWGRLGRLGLNFSLLSASWTQLRGSWMPLELNLGQPRANFLANLGKLWHHRADFGRPWAPQVLSKGFQERPRDPKIQFSPLTSVIFCF